RPLARTALARPLAGGRGDKRRKNRGMNRLGTPGFRRVLVLAALIALWEVLARLGMLNPFYAPPPSRVGLTLIDLFTEGNIWPHLQATFSAAILGLVLGVLIGAILGIAAALTRGIAELLEPVMVL